MIVAECTHEYADIEHVYPPDFGPGDVFRCKCGEEVPVLECAQNALGDGPFTFNTLRLVAQKYFRAAWADEKCQECGKFKPDVSLRLCGFALEINDKEIEELICDDCEESHCDDI